MIALVLAAAETGGEPSKTAFYIAGGVLVVFAVLIGVLGTRGAESFPASKRARNLVCLLATALVAATMATAVLTG